MTGTGSEPSGTRYETLRLLAKGGMGSVEIAAVRKQGFRRLFAVKRLRTELLADTRAADMLIEEGRIAGLLRHPNVVHVVDVGRDDAGPFLVMELVRGIQAYDLVVWARDHRTLLDVQLVLELMHDVANGLHAAHELVSDAGEPLHLVHRDMSPQNIIVGFDGVARVTDFGIAKALDAANDNLTTTGLLKGKLGYMSPEQLRFETLDRGADLFALGIVLYELLAGRRLYREETAAATARRILHEDPPDIGEIRDDVPPSVVELLYELLAKDRASRPATAKEVALRLQEALAELVVERGAFDVESFLAEEFSERLEETRGWSKLADEPDVNRPVIEVASSVSGARDSSDVASTTVASTTVDTPQPSAARSRRALWAAALGVVALVGVGTFFALGDGSDRSPTAPAGPPPSVAVPLASPPLAAIAAPPLAGTSAPPVDVPAAPLAGAPPAEPLHVTEGVAPSAPPSPRTRPRRARRVRPHADAPDDGAGDHDEVW